MLEEAICFHRAEAFRDTEGSYTQDALLFVQIIHMQTKIFLELLMQISSCYKAALLCFSLRSTFLNFRTLNKFTDQSWWLFGADVTSFSHIKTEIEVHKLRHWNPLYPCFTGGDPAFTGKAWWGRPLHHLGNQNRGQSSLGRYCTVNSDRIPFGFSYGIRMSSVPLCFCSTH